MSRPLRILPVVCCAVALLGARRACAIVGGDPVDRDGAVCQLGMLDADGVVLRKSSGVLIAPGLLATARHAFDDERTRGLRLSCGGLTHRFVIDASDARSARANEVALVRVPGAWPLDPGLAVPRTEAAWRDARARATRFEVIGFGGQMGVPAAEVRSILLELAANFLDPATLDADARRVTEWSARVGDPRLAPPPDPYLRGVLTAAVRARLEARGLAARPTSTALAPLRPGSRHGFEILDPRVTGLDGDSGGAVVAHHPDGSRHLVGIVARGRLRLEVLPFGSLHVRRAWRRVRASVVNFAKGRPSRRGPLRATIFAARLVDGGRVAHVEARPCVDALTSGGRMPGLEGSP